MRFLVSSFAFVVACGSSEKPPAEAPHAPHATEHRDAAQAHAARAAQLARLSDASRRDTPRADATATGLWLRSLEEERAADAHLAEADRIDQAAAQACAGMTDDTKQRSPLQRFAIGWLPKPDGIVVLLPVGAGTADQLVAELRCHRAWLHTGKMPGDQCPLDLPDVDIVAYGDNTGISIELTPRDSALVPEIQRRTEYAIAHGTHAR